MKALTLTLVFFFCCAVAAQQVTPLQPVNLADFVNRKTELCESSTAAMYGITQRAWRMGARRGLVCAKSKFDGLTQLPRSERSNQAEIL